MKEPDFQKHSYEDDDYDTVIQIGKAQDAFDEWLREQPEVYGIKDPLEIALPFSAQQKPGDTHKARLVDVKEMRLN